MNEAAERLRGSFDGISQTTADGVTWFDPEQELDAALAAERRATVARIKELILNGTHLAAVFRILDAEMNR